MHFVRYGLRSIALLWWGTKSTPRSLKDSVFSYGSPEALVTLGVKSLVLAVLKITVFVFLVFTTFCWIVQNLWTLSKFLCSGFLSLGRWCRVRSLKLRGNSISQSIFSRSSRLMDWHSDKSSIYLKRPSFSLMWYSGRGRIDFHEIFWKYFFFRKLCFKFGFLKKFHKFAYFSRYMP